MEFIDIIRSTLIIRDLPCVPLYDTVQLQDQIITLLTDDLLQGSCKQIKQKENKTSAKQSSQSLFCGEDCGEDPAVGNVPRNSARDLFAIQSISSYTLMGSWS